jgi:hypothetical protein
MITCLLDRLLIVGARVGGSIVVGLSLATSTAIAIEVTGGPTLRMNPNDVTPLAAVVELTTDVPVRVTLSMANGTDTHLVEFPEFATNHSVPVLGLKANTAYTVDIVLVGQSDRSVLFLRPSLPAVTDPLPLGFPSIDVISSQPALMEPGYTLLDPVFASGRSLSGRRSLSMLMAQ